MSSANGLARTRFFPKPSKVIDSDRFNNIKHRSSLDRKYRSKSIRGKGSNTDGFHRFKNTQRRYQNDLANAGRSLVSHIIARVWRECGSMECIQNIMPSFTSGIYCAATRSFLKSSLVQPSSLITICTHCSSRLIVQSIFLAWTIIGGC